MDFSWNHAAVLIINRNRGLLGVSLFTQLCLLLPAFSKIMLIDLLWPCLLCYLSPSCIFFLTVASRKTWSVLLNILDRSWRIPGTPPENPMLFSSFLLSSYSMTLCCPWPIFALLALPRGPAWQLMGSFRAEHFMDTSGSHDWNSYQRSIYRLHNKNSAGTLCQSGYLSSARTIPQSPRAVGRLVWVERCCFRVCSFFMSQTRQRSVEL